MTDKPIKQSSLKKTENKEQTTEKRIFSGLEINKARDGFVKWMIEVCTKTLIQNQDDPNIKKIMNNIKFDFGSAPRLSFTRILKNNIVLLTTSVITTAFKLADPSIPNSEIIYSFLYTNPNKDNMFSGVYTGTERLAHQLYCSSASLLSRDGEYRQRINPVYNLMSLI